MPKVEANGFTFDYREAGSGEPVLLLHGFPETSHMWVRLMGDLAAEGFHCVAPDMRGYSPGARPDEVSAYNYEHLVADVFAIADAVGFDRFHLIAHDWGAIVSWAVLSVDPSRIVSYSSMSIAHYRSFAEAVRDDPEEEFYRSILTSFVSDGFGEALVANDCAIPRAMWAASAPEEIEAYVSVLGDPKAMQAALNYYVACDSHMRALSGEFEINDVATPTLLLWGKTDAAVREASVTGAAKYMTGPYRRVDVDCGHFMVQEAYEPCRDEVLRHLRENAI